MAHPLDLDKAIPLRLRDLRRILSKTLASSSRNYYYKGKEGLDLWSRFSGDESSSSFSPFSSHEDIGRVVAAIDRAINIYGPDYIIEEEKDCPSGSGQPDESEDSDEDEQKQGGADPQGEAAEDDGDAEGDGTGEDGAESQGDGGSLGQELESRGDAGLEPSATSDGRGTLDGEDPELGDDPQGECSSPSEEDKSGENQAEASSSDDLHSPAAETFNGGGDVSSPSTTPRVDSGGDYSGNRVVDPPNRMARRIIKELRRIARSVSADKEDRSPRIDPKLLAREIVSKRYSLSRTRRREVGLPKIVVAGDVSGSCSAYAPEVAAAVEALSQHPQIEGVLHSNGIVEEADLASLCKEAELVIAFGDWDAADEYTVIAAERRLIWLDSYTCSSVGRVRDQTDSAREQGVPCERYIVGVGCAHTALHALRLI